MADLIPIGTWTCASNTHWSTLVLSKGKFANRKGKTYRVTWCQCFRPEAAQYDWECDCPSFMMQRGLDDRGYCKHIRGVIEAGERCGWNSTLEPTAECNHNEMGDPCCPDCGGPVEAVMVGV